MRRKAVFVSGFMALLLGMFILSGCAAEAKNTSEVFAKMQEASQSLNGFAMEMQMNANMDQAGNQVQFITSSSFSVTVVYAQSLLPGHVGLVSGLIIGLAFGLGGVGALAIGELIENFGIGPIIQSLGFLPLLGILSFLLPSDKKLASWTTLEKS